MQPEQTTLDPTAPPPPRILVHKDKIKVGERFRKEYGDLNELANSIKEVGLIHPITVDENWNLVAGGRRYTAMTQNLKWDLIPINLGETNGSEAKLRMMELEENFQRLEMTWKERVNIIAEVHRLHKKEAFAAGEKWTQEQTGALLGVSTGNVSYCLEMTRLLKDPKHPVQKADSLTEAFKVLLQMKEDEAIKIESQFAAEVVREGSSKNVQPKALSIDALIKGLEKPRDTSPVAQVQPGSPAPTTSQPTDATPVKEVIKIDLSKYLWKGDSIKIMNEMQPEQFDHIVTDIPYGIEMDNLNQEGGGMANIERTAAEHDVDSNVKLFHDFFPAAFRVLKPNSFCVVWYDNVHWDLMYNLALKAGFKVSRWPLVWVKTHRCQNMAAQYNFTKATEFAMVCRKGNATLTSPQGVNYWIGSNEEDKAKFGHPFAKPEELWRWIYQAIAIKGQTIYDPFMGVGSGTVAAAKAGYHPRGSEINEQHFNRAVLEFKNLMTSWFHGKEVVFV